MPFVIHILTEDVELWEPVQHGDRFNYRLKQRVYRPEFDEIKVSAPARLDFLVDQDLRCWINIERGFMSEQTGARERTHLALEALKHPVAPGQRLLRLAIERIDASTQPPRVFLKEWKP